MLAMRDTLAGGESVHRNAADELAAGQEFALQTFDGELADQPHLKRDSLACTSQSDHRVFEIWLLRPKERNATVRDIEATDVVEHVASWRTGTVTRSERLDPRKSTPLTRPPLFEAGGIVIGTIVLRHLIKNRVADLMSVSLLVALCDLSVSRTRGSRFVNGAFRGLVGGRFGFDLGGRHHRNPTLR